VDYVLHFTSSDQVAEYIKLFRFVAHSFAYSAFTTLAAVYLFTRDLQLLYDYTKNSRSTFCHKLNVMVGFLDT